MAGSVSGRRLLAAFVWLHWREQANALQARRRGIGVKVGAWVQVIARALLALLLLGMTVAFTAGLAFAGAALARGGDPMDVAVLSLRIGLGLVTALTLVLAALRAGFSGTSSLERLLLLPLPRRILHRLAALVFVADPWLLALLPGLLVLAAMLAGRGPAAVALALAAGLLLVLALGSAASATAQAVRLLLRNRRRAEAVIAVALLVLMLVSMAPGMFVASRETASPPAGQGEEAGGAREAERPGSPENGEQSEPTAAGSERPPDAGELVRSFPWLLQAVPSEAYARVVTRAVEGEPLAALPSLAALAMFAGAAWILSRQAWERLVGSPASAGRRGRARLPSWRGEGAADAGSGAVAARPASRAVAGAFVRISLRTVQGKIVLIAPAVAALALSVMGEAAEGPFAGWTQGPALLVAAAFMALSANQNVLFNLFGIDRSGLTLELLSPMSARQLLLGRALGGAVLMALALAPALAAAALVGGLTSPAGVAATLLGLVAAYALFFPFAAWLSLLFPKAADLGKLGREGKPHPAAALLGFVGLVVVLTVAGGVGVGGSLAAGPAGAIAAEALFALAALLTFPWLLSWTAAGLEMRREAVYLAVRGG